MRAVQAVAGDRVIRAFGCVESGCLSQQRKNLEAVARRAERDQTMIVAFCRNRLFRPAAYYRGHKDAKPAAKDWSMWREIMAGVPAATVIDPTASEREQHSALTKLTEKAGRTGSITAELLREVVAALGRRIRRPQGWGWERPVARVAEQFGLTENAIRHALRKP